MFVRKLIGRLSTRWMPLLIAMLLVGCDSPTPTPPPPTPVAMPFFRNAQAQPLPNQTFVVYCHIQPSYNAAAIAPTPQEIVTDANGQATRWPANCSNVVALQPQPALARGYDVYVTSWDPGTAVTQDATQDIFMTEHLLVVFNPVVSLAWEPATGSSVLDVDKGSSTVASLTAAFTAASGYLYEATNGQMLFGNVQIYTNGKRWDEADFRVLADNDRRPSANVGGMVETAVKHTLPPGQTFADLIFYPGHVTLGRGWSNKGPAQGVWGEADGWRTLVHEWGHYALFLFDEYLTLNNVSTSCSCPHGDSSCVSSIMDWHYDLNRTEFHGSRADASCTDTQQWGIYGQDDWQTLVQWFSWQNIPGLSLQLPAVAQTGTDLTFASYLVSPTVLSAPTAVHEPTLQLVAPPGGQLLAQVYTVHHEPEKDVATSILYQGSHMLYSPSGEQRGQLTLLGIPEDSSNHSLFVGVNQFGPSSPYRADAFSYTGALALPEVAVSQNTWEPNLTVQYTAKMMDQGTQTAVVDTMTLRLELVDYPVFAQLCTPAPLSSGSKCYGPWDMIPDSSTGQLVRTISAAELGGTFPNYSLLRLWVQTGEPAGYPELIRWIEIGRVGAGPGGGCAHAPLQDGNQTRTLGMTTATKWDTECSGLVAYMPVVNTTALNGVDVPNEVQGFVAPPVIVQDIPLDNFCSATQDSAVTVSYDDLAVCQVAAQAQEISYDYEETRKSLERLRQILTAGENNREEVAKACEDLLQTGDRLEETHLQLLQFNAQTEEWVLLPSEGLVDKSSNLLSARTAGDGIFAIVFTR